MTARVSRLKSTTAMHSHEQCATAVLKQRVVPMNSHYAKLVRLQRLPVGHRAHRFRYILAKGNCIPAVIFSQILLSNGYSVLCLYTTAGQETE